MIYLIEKEIISEKEEIETILVKIPLKENKLKFPFDELLESFSIKFEKEISCLNIFFPSEQINVVISLVVDKIAEQTLKELNTSIPINTALTKNFEAESTSFPV